MRLDWYLEKNDIPAKEFAAKVGVHRTSIYRFMKGLTFPRPATVQKISEVTGGRVTANDFVDLASKKRPQTLAAAG